MARSWLLLALVCAGIALAQPGVAPATEPRVQSARWVQTALADWLPGTFTNTYVEGTGLRLQPGHTSGEYQSVPFQTTFGFNGAVVETVVQATTAQTLTLELRGSFDGQQWLPWQPAERAVQANERTISRYVAFRPFTSWLQYRVSFVATTASPQLDEIAVTYLNTTAGPALVDLVARTPLSGPATLTPSPNVITRTDWNGGTSTRLVERQSPQRIELSQIQVPADDPNSAATLRALQWVSTNRYDQPDLPFHYLLNARGTLFEGQPSPSMRLSEGASGTVRIGLLADVEHEGVSEAVDASLTVLLAWLGEAYSILPAAIIVADDAPPQLHDHLTAWRDAVDRTTVRWQRFFPEGTPANGVERLVLLNSEEREVHATLIGYTTTNQQRRSLVVPPRQRVDVTLNSTFPGTGELGLQVLADYPLVAERTQIVNHELLISTGAATPLRTWYFAAGDTTGSTQSYLLVMNPALAPSVGELTFYPIGSPPVTKTVTFAPQVRSTILLNELLPNQHFALKLHALQPVVAERSMFTGVGAASLGTGLDHLSQRWLFAEGTTTTGYTTTLHVLNPWPQQVAITIQILSEDGTTVSRRYAIPRTAPLVLAINEIAPAVPFALDMQADRPLAVERQLDSSNGQAMTIGSGATSPQTRWLFAEGSTAAPAEQFLLIVNPQPAPVTLDVTYLLADGTMRHHTHTMPGTARLTIAAGSDVPNQPVVSTAIIADRPIVAERSIYVHAATGIEAETTLGTGGP